MLRISIFIFISIFTISSFAQDKSDQRVDKKNKIIYKYKKYEKFDFDDLVIEGETGSPGDLSTHIRGQTRFRNILPYRKNFNPEIKKSVERVR